MLTIAKLICAILALWAVPADAIFCTGECKESGIRCPDPYSYQICVNMSDYAVAATTAKQCPDGTICTDQGNFPCKVGTVPVPTTTPKPTTLPPCSGPAKFPTSSCNTYFECVQTLWWWSPATQTCPDGQNFDPSTAECSNTYKCGPSTTTVAPSDPKCTGSGRLPGPTSNQYYECELIWFQWQPQLKTCPDGQTYDKTTAQCVGGSKSLSENVAVPEETIDVLKNLFSQIETMFS
ncbi:hypothetical protein Zmor_020393 [Zophobas morio]|uniref:Chitin-binding type-2 domain-containing protein n=1 Tax=Zophobas morio TaxID=2755281 RepID=A0AA38I3U2_9CUCU|nr:hypothetical protein Zmor_020393 [Zophobas morio]